MGKLSAPIIKSCVFINFISSVKFLYVMFESSSLSFLLNLATRTFILLLLNSLTISSTTFSGTVFIFVLASGRIKTELIFCWSVLIVSKQLLKNVSYDLYTFPLFTILLNLWPVKRFNIDSLFHCST